MNKKIIIFWSFAIFLQNSFSQNSFPQIDGITKTPDGRGFTIQGQQAWFDVSGNSISMEQFNDSLKTGNYNMSIHPDTLVNKSFKLYLENKYPSKSKFIGTTVPSLTYPDIYGKAVKIGGDAKFSVLLFWSITCSPCIQELIVLNALAKDFPNFDFYALTTDNKTAVADFLNQKNYKWDNIFIISDYNLSDYDTEVDSYPVCVIMNKERIVQDVCFNGNLRQTIALMENLDKKNSNE